MKAVTITHQGEAGVELPHVHPSGPAGVEPAVSGHAAFALLLLLLIADEGRGRLRGVRVQVNELRILFMSRSVTFQFFYFLHPHFVCF